IPEALQPLFAEPFVPTGGSPDSVAQSRRGSPVHARHRLGDDLLASARTLVLRDDLGERIGKAVFFHAAEHQDAPLYGTVAENHRQADSVAQFEQRIEAAFDDFRQRGIPFSLFWITVDQAHDLRHSHGDCACETMLDCVERALANRLRPQEELGRWGDDEFLILSQERRPPQIAAFAQLIAGFTRTTDFRWWGDRIPLTVSVGAALSEPQETLAQVLDRARDAMRTSLHAGGNHMTMAPRRSSVVRSGELPTVIRPPTGNPAAQDDPQLVSGSNANASQHSTHPEPSARSHSCSQS
ncbi:MAG TPA: diguanylate cyclase, partial [Terracidiphilus sp.]|nr:diguanylate cyclase [Terracidiphilus sp.]